MHLKRVTMKGFKSFPDRTSLDFAPGVSVIVGPNGSGKSNITEAVLWALGEQSPLQVRGQSMQDVIFAGGHGLPSRNAAEVEVVLDNADGSGGEFSEISIVRRLERSGEGEYRLNGARCRLVDVLEMLSDTGLGREMHSVVSQGKVEAIVHSRPRDRRLLIEEAAGLGKHRKRRRRAQLKLERTEENLARALDVEREARSRLRPLKRQAEAAQLHERLERQSLEARLELARDEARAHAAELDSAEATARGARERREGEEQRLAVVSKRRETAESALAAHTRAREVLTGRLYAARSAGDRIAMRAERAREAARAAVDDARRGRADLEVLAAQGQDADGAEGGPDPVAERIAALEGELEELEAGRQRRLDTQLASLVSERAALERRAVEVDAVVEHRRIRMGEAERAAETARAERLEAEAAVEAARVRAAAADAELAGVEAFLSAAGGAPSGNERTFADSLRVAPGYERALAAALGPRLNAATVGNVAEGEALLDRSGEAGGHALVAGLARRSGPGGVDSSGPPADGAERLLDQVEPEPAVASLASRLLADVWVVDSLDAVREDFAGVAVTRSGRALAAGAGELRQARAGAEERVLTERNRREELAVASRDAAAAEGEAREAVERATAAVREAEALCEAAAEELRSALRAADEAADELRRVGERIDRAREAPDEGPTAVRRAQVEAELRAERRLAEQAERERAERDARGVALRDTVARCDRLAEVAERAAEALATAEAAVADRATALQAALDADEAVGERTAAELRACAREEVEIQRRLSAASEEVTAAEVRAQRTRDAAEEAGAELREIAGRLGLGEEAAEPLSEPLGDERREELDAQIERLGRRRAQIGPVNPLAAREYEEAVEHVEELETQRADLESAIHELEKLIRDTDRRIRESFETTFEAAARNFEDLVGHLFPGGRGRLRLERADGPRPVLAGGPVEGEVSAAAEETDSVDEGDEAAAGEQAEPGVEVEVNPAGKAMKRLSLLSGGEKSLVAIAFLFAVFLARPCPFYVLDEVEAALDDPNIDRFLELLRRYSDRAQFIVVTHQRRTMSAADRLYGVSMGADGVSKVVSRRLPGEDGEAGGAPLRAAEAAA